MYKNFILFIAFCLSAYISPAQCTQASFTLSDTVCTGTPLPVVNNSTGNGFTYNWDFCPTDLRGPIAFGGGCNLLGHAFSSISNFKIFKENNHYYFFVYDTSQAQFVQADYAQSLENTGALNPVANNNVINNYPKANCFDVIKDGSTWYGVAAYAPTNSLYLLTFSTNLLAAPTATPISSINNLNDPYAIKLLKLDGIFYALITNHGDNSLSCISFGNTMTNTPSSLYKTTLTGANGLCDIDVMPLCNNITGFASNLNATNLLKLDWGNNIAVAPVVSSVATNSAGYNYGISIGHEGNYYYVFYMGPQADTLYRMEYLNDFNAAPVHTPLLWGYVDCKDVQFVSDSSKNFVFFADDGIKLLFELYYMPACTGNYYDTSASPSFSYPVAGTYTTALNITDSLGYISNQTQGVTLIPGPSASFTSANTCANDSVLFTDNSTTPNGTITGWLWDFGDTFTSTLQNPKHKYVVAGIYTVTLTITNSTGCNAITSQSITISEAPVAAFSATTVCAGSSTVFTDLSTITSGSIQTWSWDFGDAGFSSIQNPSHIYSMGGTYNAQLTVTSSSGCIDSVTVPVTVSAAPQISYTTANTCATDTVIFTNTTTIIGGGAITYVWDFGDGSPTTTVASPSHHYASAGTYIVTLIATGGAANCSDTLIQNIVLSAPAMPAFNFPSSGCQGNAMQFTDLSTGTGISAWTWIFGDGDSAFVQNPAHVYSTSGNYNVTLIVTVGTSCNSSITQQVSVTGSPVANFTANKVCLSNPTSFNDLSTGSTGTFINSWLWDFGDGASDTVQFPFHTYTTAGIYIATLEVTSNIGCTDTISVAVTVDDVPLPGFTTSALHCSGNLIQFTDTTFVMNDSIITWFWDFNDGTTSTLQNPSHAFAAGGIKIVTLTAISSAGCSATAQLPVTVQQSPQFTFLSSQGCLGDSTQFTYVVTGISAAFTYNWNFGDGTHAYIPSPKHLFSASGNYNVTLTVLDSAGCSVTVADTITVNAKPDAAFTQTGICVNSPVQFTNFSTITQGTIINYDWNFGDNSFSTASDPAHLYSDTGSYMVSLAVSSDGGCTDTAKQNISIYPAPAAAFSIPLFGAPGAAVNFSNTSSSATQYNWSFGDNNFSIAAEPLHIYTDTGSYLVTLITTNTYGCTDTAFKTMIILEPYLDLVMRNVKTSLQNNFLYLTAEIFNAGNIPAYNYILQSQIEGGEPFSELANEIIPPGSIKQYPLSSGFYASQAALPAYACITITGVNDGVDAILSNNNKCSALSNIFDVSEIYPNPNAGNLAIQYILPADGIVEIDLYDLRGRKIKEFLLASETKGYHLKQFDAKHISRGFYFLRVSYEGTTLNRRFFKF